MIIAIFALIGLLISCISLIAFDPNLLLFFIFPLNFFIMLINQLITSDQISEVESVIYRLTAIAWLTYIPFTFLYYFISINAFNVLLGVVSSIIGLFFADRYYKFSTNIKNNDMSEAGKPSVATDTNYRN